MGSQPKLAPRCVRGSRGCSLVSFILKKVSSAQSTHYYAELLGVWYRKNS